MTRQLIAALALAAAAAPAFARSRVDLNGPWRFAIDPHRKGEKNGWAAHEVPRPQHWGSQVIVPHCWPVGPRYPYNGPAWYRRSFPTPPEAAGRHVRLVFEAVFYRTRVWLNGRLLGAHEGGYTPFEFDVTGVLLPRGDNSLALEVDNSWSDATIPGARPGPRPEDQVYPWWDYGGIVRDVYLAITAPVYVSAQRIMATPNLGDGTARLSTTVWVRNTTGAAARVRVSQQARFGSPERAAAGAPGESSVSVGPNSTVPVELRWQLRRGDVRLWDQDHPNLYRMRTSLKLADSAQEADVDEATFGIRSIETRGQQLLLNGQAIKMGGANRHSDHPRFGLIDPKEVIDQDMTLMKTANMELARISHYPVPAALLDWADRHGWLIIEQVPIWGNTAPQLESEPMRALFRSQMEEMIRRDWNHPSVIGWSVGNEYQSATPAGVQWTKDMAAFVRTLDPSRLTTLASMYAFRTSLTRPEEEGSHHVDLINVNVYGNPEQVRANLERVHSLWPDRVLLISEFASLDALTVSDAERDSYVRKYLEVVRTLPYVAGVSLWTYNDYRSRWPQTSGWPSTSEDGYRHFGAVTADRRPTALYHTLREEFSPVVLGNLRAENTAGKATVRARVAARSDFPSYPVRDYTVRCSWLDAGKRVLGGGTANLPALRPGEAAEVACVCASSEARQSAAVRVEVVRPTGFATVERTLDLPK